jgi:hypothetical protein
MLNPITYSSIDSIACGLRPNATFKPLQRPSNLSLKGGKNKRGARRLSGEKGFPRPPFRYREARPELVKERPA